jgi:hypothetical protein
MTDMTFEQLCELFAYTPKRRPLDTKEVADLFGLNVNTLEQYRFRGEGPRYFSPPGTRRVWYRPPRPSPNPCQQLLTTCAARSD